MESNFEIQTLFDPVYLINLFIALALLFAATMSAYYMFYGGIALILSGGQDDKIKEAMGTIRYAIIGLVVVGLAILFIFLLGNFADFPVIEYINLETMWEVLKGVGEKVFNGPNTASFTGSTAR